MPTIPVNDVGQFGVVKDRPPHLLPLNAWSDGLNVRARDGFVEKFTGEQAVLGTPQVAPYGLFPVSSGGEVIWVYAGLTDVYCVKDRVHTEISRTTGGDYTATINTPWTATNLQGVFIINNENDAPQMWTPIAPGTALVALSNWTSTHRCKVMRAFRQYLVAVNITKGATEYPQMVKWSHGAAAGAVPSSWDETDATKDAGEYDLADSPGQCMDALPLRDIMAIYKEDAIWGMQYVGGVKVMRFFRLFDGVGVASQRCVAEYTFGQHVVLGKNDIFVHDGQNRRSILDAKLRRSFYKDVNPSAFARSFVAVNEPAREVWFCVATGSATWPDKALVWNWLDNTLMFRELDSISAAALGALPGYNPRITEDAMYRITEDGSPRVLESGVEWLFNPLASGLVLVRPSSAAFLQADDTDAFSGVAMTAYLERTGMGIPFRAGQPPDTSSMKFMTALWPRITGTAGGVVKVYVGSQMEPEGDVTWASPVNFVIGTTKQVPVRVSGRTFALKFESTTDLAWCLEGFDMDVKQTGRF